MAKVEANAKQYTKRHHSAFERMEVSEVIFKVISYVLLTIFAIMCLYPFVYSISAAISGYDAMEGGKVVLLPIDIQWDALIYVLSDAKFWISYANTLFITLYGVIYMMAITLLGAYALAKTRMFGNKLFNFLLVFTMWFAAGMIPVWLNYNDTWTIMTNMGFTDSKWLIVIAMGFSAFNVIVMRNAFQSVPKEIEEAATVDGANDFQIMWKVFTPMSKASVATVALFYGVSRWNGYFWARQMADPTYDVPLQVYIRIKLEDIQQNGDSYANWGNTHNFTTDSLIYAMVVCSIIPILIIYPFIQKYFAAGVNVGGVKE